MASARQESELRRRRRVPAKAPGVDALAPGPSAAQVYELLLLRLDQLRVAVTGERPDFRSLAEIRAAHVDLHRGLGDAVTQAFAADATDATLPSGVPSWAAEGLARSQERELALLSASDVSGLRQVTTRVNPAESPWSGGS